MADKSLFPRLKRLFSTDVVIRNVGGKKLKVADASHIQAFGSIQTNALVDRYARIYKSNRYNSFNPTLNYAVLRTQIYADYEAMDTDAIIAPALDMLAEDCVTENELGEILTINSSNEDIQEILYNLFYDVLNIDFNLYMWIRSMAKYGDFYLKLDIGEDFGVFNVKPISVYDIVRQEGTDPDNPNSVEFVYDPQSLMGGSPAQSNKKLTLDYYEVAHFRYNIGPEYLPYGRSYIEPARKLYKQLTLLEDSALIHRIMRAPEKRIFYYNVGNIAPTEIDAFIEKQISNTKRTPFIDPQTGDYNLKFNMQNMTEDFHIPVRGNDQITKLDTAKGLEYAGMEDIEYLRDKMFSALRLPKAFLNYSDELNGKSTLAGLDVRWARTVTRLQKIILSELKKIAMIHLYTIGYKDADLLNFKLSLNNPSILLEQEKVDLLQKKVELSTQIIENNLLSTDYIYENIFNLSEDSYNQERDLIDEDVKRKFRLSQIENEGNDPIVSGVSYGTPHDLASAYSDKKDPGGELPDGYDDEKEPIGRPKKSVSAYGKQDHWAGRDPLGTDGRKDRGVDNRLRPQVKGGSLALENKKSDRFKKGVDKFLQKKNDKKILIYEKDNEKYNLLDESNIKPEII